MAEDQEPVKDSSSWGAQQWWASRRRRYNVGLVVAGILGFLAYGAAVQRCIDRNVPGDWEITIFTTFFQGIAYVVMMGVANLCYFIGPWSEGLLHPGNIATYRKIAFQLGFWFSFFLPFTPASLLFVECSKLAARGS